MQVPPQQVQINPQQPTIPNGVPPQQINAPTRTQCQSSRTKGKQLPSPSTVQWGPGLASDGLFPATSSRAVIYRDNGAGSHTFGGTQTHIGGGSHKCNGVSNTNSISDEEVKVNQNGHNGHVQKSTKDSLKGSMSSNSSSQSQEKDISNPRHKLSGSYESNTSAGDVFTSAGDGISSSTVTWSPGERSDGVGTTAAWSPTGDGVGVGGQDGGEICMLWEEDNGDGEEGEEVGRGGLQGENVENLVSKPKDEVNVEDIVTANGINVEGDNEMVAHGGGSGIVENDAINSKESEIRSQLNVNSNSLSGGGLRRSETRAGLQEILTGVTVKDMDGDQEQNHTIPVDRSIPVDHSKPPPPTSAQCIPRTLLSFECESHEQLYPSFGIIQGGSPDVITHGDNGSQHSFLPLQQGVPRMSVGSASMGDIASQVALGLISGVRHNITSESGVDTGGVAKVSGVLPKSSGNPGISSSSAPGDELEQVPQAIPISLDDDSLQRLPRGYPHHPYHRPQVEKADAQEEDCQQDDEEHDHNAYDAQEYAQREIPDHSIQPHQSHQSQNNNIMGETDDQFLHHVLLRNKHRSMRSLSEGGRSGGDGDDLEGDGRAWSTAGGDLNYRGIDNYGDNGGDSSYSHSVGEHGGVGEHGEIFQGGEQVDNHGEHVVKNVGEDTDGEIHIDESHSHTNRGVGNNIEKPNNTTNINAPVMPPAVVPPPLPPSIQLASNANGGTQRQTSTESRGGVFVSENRVFQISPTASMSSASGRHAVRTISKTCIHFDEPATEKEPDDLHRKRTTQGDQNSASPESIGEISRDQISSTIAPGSACSDPTTSGPLGGGGYGYHSRNERVTAYEDGGTTSNVYHYRNDIAMDNSGCPVAGGAVVEVEDNNVREYTSESESQSSAYNTLNDTLTTNQNRKFSSGIMSSIPSMKQNPKQQKQINLQQAGDAPLSWGSLVKTTSKTTTARGGQNDDDCAQSATNASGHIAHLYENSTHRDNNSHNSHHNSHRDRDNTIHRDTHTRPGCDVKPPLICGPGDITSSGAKPAVLPIGSPPVGSPPIGSPPVGSPPVQQPTISQPTISTSSDGQSVSIVDATGKICTIPVSTLLAMAASGGVGNLNLSGVTGVGTTTNNGTTNGVASNGPTTNGVKKTGTSGVVTNGVSNGIISHGTQVQQQGVNGLTQAQVQHQVNGGVTHKQDQGHHQQGRPSAVNGAVNGINQLQGKTQNVHPGFVHVFDPSSNRWLTVPAPDGMMNMNNNAQCGLNSNPLNGQQIPVSADTGTTNGAKRQSSKKRKANQRGTSSSSSACSGSVVSGSVVRGSGSVVPSGSVTKGPHGSLAKGGNKGNTSVHNHPNGITSHHDNGITSRGTSFPQDFETSFPAVLIKNDSVVFEMPDGSKVGSVYDMEFAKGMTHGICNRDAVGNQHEHSSRHGGGGNRDSLYGGNSNGDHGGHGPNRDRGDGNGGAGGRNNRRKKDKKNLHTAQNGISQNGVSGSANSFGTGQSSSSSGTVYDNSDPASNNINSQMLVNPRNGQNKRTSNKNRKKGKNILPNQISNHLEEHSHSSASHSEVSHQNSINPDGRDGLAAGANTSLIGKVDSLVSISSLVPPVPGQPSRTYSGDVGQVVSSVSAPQTGVSTQPGISTSTGVSTSLDMLQALKLSSLLNTHNSTSNGGVNVNGTTSTTSTSAILGLAQNRVGVSNGTSGGVVVSNNGVSNTQRIVSNPSFGGLANANISNANVVPGITRSNSNYAIDSQTGGSINGGSIAQNLNLLSQYHNLNSNFNNSNRTTTGINTTGLTTGIGSNIHTTGGSSNSLHDLLLGAQNAVNQQHHQQQLVVNQQQLLRSTSGAVIVNSSGSQLATSIGNSRLPSQQNVLSASTTAGTTQQTTASGVHPLGDLNNRLRQLEHTRGGNPNHGTSFGDLSKSGLNLYENLKNFVAQNSSSQGPINSIAGGGLTTPGPPVVLGSSGGTLQSGGTLPTVGSMVSVQGAAGTTAGCSRNNDLPITGPLKISQTTTQTATNLGVCTAVSSIPNVNGQPIAVGGVPNMSNQSQKATVVRPQGSLSSTMGGASTAPYIPQGHHVGGATSSSATGIASSSMGSAAAPWHPPQGSPSQVETTHASQTHWGTSGQQQGIAHFINGGAHEQHLQHPHGSQTHYQQHHPSMNGAGAGVPTIAGAMPHGTTEWVPGPAATAGHAVLHTANGHLMYPVSHPATHATHEHLVQNETTMVQNGYPAYHPHGVAHTGHTGVTTIPAAHGQLYSYHKVDPHTGTTSAFGNGTNPSGSPIVHLSNGIAVVHGEQMQNGPIVVDSSGLAIQGNSEFGGLVGMEPPYIKKKKRTRRKRKDNTQAHIDFEQEDGFPGQFPGQTQNEELRIEELPRGVSVKSNPSERKGSESSGYSGNLNMNKENNNNNPRLNNHKNTHTRGGGKGNPQKNSVYIHSGSVTFDPNKGAEAQSNIHKRAHPPHNPGIYTKEKGAGVGAAYSTNHQNGVNGVNNQGPSPLQFEGSHQLTPSPADNRNGPTHKNHPTSNPHPSPPSSHPTSGILVVTVKEGQDLAARPPGSKYYVKVELGDLCSRTKSEAHPSWYWKQVLMYQGQSGNKMGQMNGQKQNGDRMRVKVQVWLQNAGKAPDTLYGSIEAIDPREIGHGFSKAFPLFKDKKLQEGYLGLGVDWLQKPAIL